MQTVPALVLIRGGACESGVVVVQSEAVLVPPLPFCGRGGSPRLDPNFRDGCNVLIFRD